MKIRVRVVSTTIEGIHWAGKWRVHHHMTDTIVATSTASRGRRDGRFKAKTDGSFQKNCQLLD